ncbi:phosphoadenylyl-sulfate reductase [Brevundimonas aurifodinae]|uniref:Adenosine 5'-phosphosulfate reductase n=2 Tax=Brevundimonas TaxID=41275 RepID=A0ABV1NRZ7_9CAUL|nr:MAG: phosphoadenosine phosphosulfate reductase [Brevundimonas sp. 12-68-7]OYX30442.1 MAG: phosphoadenosine phosphosulfate reductase [Brevundimonas subvibrioides]
MRLFEHGEIGPQTRRLTASTPLDQVEAAASDGAPIMIEFEAFRDGRGFSLATILRERGFSGSLIATGDLLPDQARHLMRSGFDAVQLRPGDDPAAWRRMLEAFSVVYQPAFDAAVPAWTSRGKSLRRPSNAPPIDEGTTLGRRAAELNAALRDADPLTVLRTVLDPRQGLRVAALSSFGAEAAVLLDLLARAGPSTPVIFLETGQHFLQTLSYRTTLSKRLGLTDVRIVVPDAEERADLDPREDLWRTDPDACCDLRKVRPLARAAAGFDALITGRKRYQSGTRARLRVIEALDGKLRINPLANWSADRIATYRAERDLPGHPLADQGYASIGCWPCTRPIEDGEDSRAGRWSGVDKVECGIHLGRRRAAA